MSSGERFAEEWPRFLRRRVDSPLERCGWASWWELLANLLALLALLSVGVVWSPGLS